MKTYNNPISFAIDSLFNQSLSDVLGVDILAQRPPVNVREESDSHILEIALPGIKKEDIQLEVEKSNLKISAKKQSSEIETEEAKSKNFLKKEFDFTSFERSFHIPETADINKIVASYDAGVLTVTISKKEEALDKGPINIKVS